MTKEKSLRCLYIFKPFKICRFSLQNNTSGWIFIRIIIKTIISECLVTNFSIYLKQDKVKTWYMAGPFMVRAQHCGPLVPVIFVV